jgi:hypothetical protein
MGERQPNPDRVLTFARERGLTVRPVPDSGDMATIALPRGDMLIDVAFKNGPQPDGRWEWFITARDARTSEQLWTDRFDYDMWFDFFGDASKDLSNEEWAEEADDHLIAFLDAVSTNEVRLAAVGKRPLFRLPGRRRVGRTKTELQLLIDGEWHVWDGRLEPVFRDERPLRR